MWVTKNGQTQVIDDETLPYWRSQGWVEWQPDAGTESTVAPAWAPQTAYQAGQLVWQAGQLYRAKADFTSAGTFSATNWDAAGSAAYLGLPAGAPAGAVGVRADSLHEQALLSQAPLPDWYRQARYGLFAHYTYGGGFGQTIQPNGTVPASLDALANAFDAATFAADAAAFGVEYVVFTAYHHGMYLMYPSTVMPGYLTGHQTTSRDVIADLIAALKPYGIKLMLYVHPTDGSDLTAGEQTATGWNDATGNYATWNAFLNAIITEIGQRYGAAVDGFWMDQTSSPEWNARIGVGTNQTTLRASLLAGHATRVIVGNDGSDQIYNNAAKAGVLDYVSREYLSKPAAVADWVAGYNQTAAQITNTDWWAVRATGGATAFPYSATDLFRFLVMQAGTNVRGGGLAVGAGPYAGTGLTSLFEDGIETALRAVAANLSPLALALKGVKRSSSYITADTVTLNTLGSPGYVATMSADAATEYVHVLNAPAGALTLPAPADGVTFTSAVNLATGRACTLELTSTGGYKITLNGADSWSAVCTTISLRRETRLGEHLFIPATDFTTTGGATLQATGGGSRFPSYTMPTGAATQVECAFMVPADWNTFDIDLYMFQASAGSGSATLSATRSQVAAGSLLTSGDEAAGLNGAVVLSGTQNTLQVVSVYRDERNTPGAISHLRMSRTNTATPDIGVLGLRLKRVT